MVLVVTGAGLIAACWLPFVQLPAVSSWPYLASSVVIHVVYFALVALSYQKGELSFAYPIMRGIAPAGSAAVAALLLNELPSMGGWLGVFLICSGVALLAADSWRSKRFQGLTAIFAVAAAGVIVLYTLVDAVGARLSEHSASYTGWMFLFTALCMLAMSFAYDGRQLAHYMIRYWARGLIGGACTLASYGLALWAMVHAPIALVAALRETSVVFAMVIAATLLGESITRARLISILIVVAGTVALKLS